MFAGSRPLVTACDRGTQTKSEARLDTFRRRTIWFSCTQCGLCTSFDRDGTREYPPDACNRCRPKQTKRYGPREEGCPFIQTPPFFPESSFDRPHHNASTAETTRPSAARPSSNRQSGKHGQAKAYPASGFNAAANKQTEPPNQNATTAPKSNTPGSIDGATIIDSIVKLSEYVMASQREHFELLNGIAENTEQLSESQKQLHTSYAEVQEENDRLRKDNQMLSARIDGLITDCNKLNTRLRSFTQPRRSAMMTEDSDEEDL